MSLQIPAVVDVEHRRCQVGAEPMVFHCHHYNAFLQQSILDAEFVDSMPFLVGAAAEVAHAQLRRIFAEQKLAELSRRQAFASELYRWAGFGTIDFAPLSEKGGSTHTPNSHYAVGWKSKFGKARAPVCHFASGWIAGALAAIQDLPLGSFSVKHEVCAATGASACTFALARGQPNYSVFQSVGMGALTPHSPRPVPPTSVDYDGILAAVSSLPLVGDANGQINAFGVFLTRQYANYYNRISFEFLSRAVGQFGERGRTSVEPLLIEAGHVCAFNTFGGIMTSTEWDALIRPTLKTREDWVHGMVAVTNALGWGRWQVTAVSPTEAEFVLHDDYEGVGYGAMYGKSSHPVEYLAMGGVAGLMNLVYVGEIEKRPELSADYYNQLFRTTRGFKVEAKTSRAMGNPVTILRVTRAP